MRHGASFADVLEATLRGRQPDSAARQAPPRAVATPLPLPPNPFLFTFDARISPFATGPMGLPNAAGIDRPEARGTGAPEREPGRRPEAPKPASAAPAADTRSARSTVAIPKPRRQLTSMQQRSLAAFVDAGASIAADFSAEELRSAFRRLARQYHPDRHPFAGDGEKAALSRQFAAITTHYEVLLTALDAAAC